jgi:hypothetical protein
MITRHAAILTIESTIARFTILQGREARAEELETEIGRWFEAWGRDGWIASVREAASKA